MLLIKKSTLPIPKKMRPFPAFFLKNGPGWTGFSPQDILTPSVCSTKKVETTPGGQ